MFNDTYDHIREIERLMRQIPNFRPRGYGVYIFRKFEYTVADCDCRYCLHNRKGYGCTEDQTETQTRLEAPSICRKESFTVMMQE